HHRNMKSTNMLERFNEEIKRRTRVVRIFPNEASCALGEVRHESAFGPRYSFGEPRLALDLKGTVAQRFTNAPINERVVAGSSSWGTCPQPLSTDRRAFGRARDNLRPTQSGTTLSSAHQINNVG